MDLMQRISKPFIKCNSILPCIKQVPCHSVHRIHIHSVSETENTASGMASKVMRKEQEKEK